MSQSTFHIDAKGLNCPLPLLKLRNSIAKEKKQYQSFIIEFTDLVSFKDIEHFCQNANYNLKIIHDPSPKKLQIDI